MDILWLKYILLKLWFWDFVYSSAEERHPIHLYNKFLHNITYHSLCDSILERDNWKKNKTWDEEIYLLEYNAVWSIGSQQKFRMNRSRPLQVASSKESFTCYLLQADFLLGLFFDSEDWGKIFPRNISCLSTDYTVLHPERQFSASSWFL
jgi:hypothetical protein